MTKGRYFYDYDAAMDAWEEGMVWNVGPSWKKNRFISARSVLEKMINSNESKGYTSKKRSVKSEQGEVKKISQKVPYAYDWFFHIYGPETDVRKTLKTVTLQDLMWENSKEIRIDFDALDEKFDTIEEIREAAVDQYVRSRFVCTYPDFAAQRKISESDDSKTWEKKGDLLSIRLSKREMQCLHFLHQHVLRFDKSDGLIAKAKHSSKKNRDEKQG